MTREGVTREGVISAFHFSETRVFDLISLMIIKVVRKYCYGKKVSSATLSLGGIKNLGSLQQSIQMEQSRFNVETK